MRRYHDMSRQLNSAQAMCSEASAKPNAGIQAGLRTDMISDTKTLKPKPMHATQLARKPRYSGQVSRFSRQQDITTVH